jgi:hypothetical protein
MGERADHQNEISERAAKSLMTQIMTDYMDVKCLGNEEKSAIIFSNQFCENAYGRFSELLR